MKGYSKTGFLLAGILVVLAIMLVSVQPVMSVENATAVTATVTVSSDIDVSLDQSSLDYTNVDPGATKAEDADPVVVTIYATTNKATNLSIRGSADFTGAGTLGLGNLSYSNSTSYTYTAMSTSYDFGTPVNYSGWKDVPDPASDTTVNIYTNITIPSGQAAGTYTTTVTIRVSDTAV